MNRLPDRISPKTYQTSSARSLIYLATFTWSSVYLTTASSSSSSLVYQTSSTRSLVHLATVQLSTGSSIHLATFMWSSVHLAISTRSLVHIHRFQRKSRGVPVTFEILNLLGWKPSPDQPQPLPRGSAELSMKELHRIDEILKDVKKVELPDEDKK